MHLPGASTGPQSFDCGNWFYHPALGAWNTASTGPQSFDCGNLDGLLARREAEALQRGRSLSTAEITACLISRARAQSFNGAAVFRLRKCRAVHSTSAKAPHASTGPQSFDCGNVAGKPRRNALPSGFNGAAVFRLRKCHKAHQAQIAEFELQRGRSLSTAEISTPPAVGARIVGLQRGRSLSTAEIRTRMQTTLPFRLQLQRGRSLSTAEIPPVGPLVVGLASASTGPQSFDCGNTFQFSRPPRTMSGFNGAAVFRLRKSRKRPPPKLDVPGFNGAAVFRLRKLIVAPIARAQRRTLQRGRSLSTAEIALSEVAPDNRIGRRIARGFG